MYPGPWEAFNMEVRASISKFRPQLNIPTTKELQDSNPQSHNQLIAFFLYDVSTLGLNILFKSTSITVLIKDPL